MSISKMSDHLASFAIGIRFRANFSIEDQLGRIVDDILYSKNAYFGPHFFPLVEGRINYKRLFAHDSPSYFEINNSNIVLDIHFSDEDKNEKIVNDVRAHFNSDIILGVMKKYGVTQINRIGYINRYVFDEKNLSKLFLDRTMGDKLGGVNDTNLRFSKRYALPESMTKKDVYDYDNVIFNIVKQNNRDELFASTDYQRLYSPFLEISDQLEFPSFVTSVDSYNEGSFKKWFNESYGEQSGRQISI